MKQKLHRSIAIIMTIMLVVMQFSGLTISAAAAAPVERIDLNIDAITIGVGQKVKTVKPVAYPKDAATTFTWESADEKIAKVNAKGKITGVKKGTTTVTVTAENGVTTEVEVKVVKKGKGVTKIALNKKTASIARGKSVTLKATLTPKKPKNKAIIWESSDESIATVSSKGKVTAVSVGTATITAISSSGKSAKCKVTVTGLKVKKIKLSGKKEMLRNEPQQLTAKITPADADNQDMKWTSANKKIATVDQNGVVTALKKGTVTITATAKDGGKAKGTFEITVKKGVFTPTPTPVPTATTAPNPTATTAPNPTATTAPAPTATYTAAPKPTPTAVPSKYTTVVKKDGTLEITGYVGADKEIQIPATIDGKAVTSIGKSAFSSCSSLTSVIIPDGVTSIGEYAFADCSNLVSITIPDGVASIGRYAFYSNNNNLKKVYANSLVGWLGITFEGYGASPLTNENKMELYGGDLYIGGELLTDAVIPDGITRIGDRAFDGCRSLTSVTIPESVTSIGEYAFFGCFFNLKKVYANSLVGWLGIAFEGTTACPLAYGGDLYIGGELLTDAVIPDETTRIGDYAFDGCSSLTSITIPDSVTSIGYCAFDGCSSLTSITIPDSVTSIEAMTFYGCSSLTSITIPEDVTSIGGYCTFEGCSSLTSITIPEGLTWIGERVFRGCSSLTSVMIPDGVTWIGEKAFTMCSSLTSITIPSSVTEIGEDAFSDCSVHLTIYGTAGSYAESYAKENSIPFSAIELDPNPTVSPNEEFDMLFSKPGTSYSAELLKKSADFALYAYDEEDCKDKLGVEEGLGFNNVESYNYDSLDKDSIGYCFGWKDVIDENGEPTRLYAVIGRGTVLNNNGIEWISNFNVGTDKYHYGFYQAATDMAMDFLGYMDKYGRTGDETGESYKIWTTGHSRAGAVTNLFVGVFLSAWGVENSDVYAYTFAAPNCVLVTESSTSMIIRNYVLAGDLVPNVPLKHWLYKKFGAEIVIENQGSDENTGKSIEMLTNMIYHNVCSSIDEYNSIYALIADTMRGSYVDHPMSIMLTAMGLGNVGGNIIDVVAGGYIVGFNVGNVDKTHKMETYRDYIYNMY